MNQQTIKWKLFLFSLEGERRNGTIPQSKAWVELGQT
jgi:hypothetical protein